MPKKVLVLNCGGHSTRWGDTKEDILQGIFYHYKLLKDKYWATENSLISYLDKHYFNGKKFTREEAKKVVDEDDMLYMTMLGSTALDLMYWYIRWGEDEKEKTRTIFDVLEEEI